MRQRHCKIVATIGPASASPAMLRMIHDAGVDVFRLNMSHGEAHEKQAIVDAIREFEAEIGTPVAIFADLQGPKIRVGKFKDGAIALKYNESYRLTFAKESDSDDTIAIPHKEILESLQPGDILKLDDGKLQIEVTAIDGNDRIAKATVPGRLSDRKGINIPGRQLPISAMTEKDRADLQFALSAKVDYIALSFVQKPEDVDEARALIGDHDIGIISKIEKPSAVEQFDAILEKTDAVMVARGDLGVECPPEDVPLIQRRIVRQCKDAGKPVIVATHMLESMVESPAPTRAEASDVSTAVYQGADAVMLSAETAVGRHPPTAVAIMDRIIRATETHRDEEPATRIRSSYDPSLTTADAITLSAQRIAEVLQIKQSVAFTKTGSTARRLSRDRPKCAIIAATPDEKVARNLALFWGVHPAVTDDISDFNEMLEKAERIALSRGAQNDDRIIILAGYPFGTRGKTNTLKISRIGSGE